MFHPSMVFKSFADNLRPQASMGRTTKRPMARAGADGGAHNLRPLPFVLKVSEDVPLLPVGTRRNVLIFSSTLEGLQAWVNGIPSRPTKLNRSSEGMALLVLMTLALPTGALASAWSAEASGRLAVGGGSQRERADAGDNLVVPLESVDTDLVRGVVTRVAWNRSRASGH